MGYCTDLKGNRLNDIIVKELILEYDFLTAYNTLCRFITKRCLEDLHKRIMKNKADYNKTIDLAPRGFGKSTIGDVDYCLLSILRDSNIRIMIGSKTQTQAEAFLKEVRTHFEQNVDLIRVFGDLKGERWSDKEFTVGNRELIKKEASLTALGASGAVVSKHFDIIIVDDLVGFENARTETQRKKLKEWFYSSLTPTLEPNGKLHIIGTRYHALDLYQDLIDSKKYNVVVQKAIEKVKGNQLLRKIKQLTVKIDKDDVVINKTEKHLEELKEELKRRKKAYRNKEEIEISLWEEKFSLIDLHSIKKESGTIIFMMQYQNSTKESDGEIFKAKYFDYYEDYQINNKNEVVVKVKDEEGQIIEKKKLRIFFGVDLAISQKTTADYFVLVVVAVDEEYNSYILDYVRERLTFDNQFNIIIKFGEQKYKNVERIGIESVAYQQALASELRRNSNLPIIDIKTNKDKISRAMRRSANFENGKVFFRKNMHELEEELLLFPNGEHDDLFDALDFAIQTAEQNKRRVSNVSRSDFRI